MELDELKIQWAAYDRKLDESIRLSRQLLRETYTRRARFALWRLAGTLALGSILLLPIIVGLGGFIAVHWSRPKLSVPAIVLDILAIAMLAALIAQIALALSIDYNQPVAVIQKRLAVLRKVRIRYVQAIFAIASLIWVPIFVVVTKAFRFDTIWIWENVAIGLGVLAIGFWLAKCLGSRFANTTLVRRFVRDLGGYNLNAATRFLDTLEEFEGDYSPQERSSIREYSPDE